MEISTAPSFLGSEKLHHRLLTAIGAAEKEGIALETILVEGIIETDSSVDMDKLTALLEATINVIVDGPTRIMTFRGNLRGVKNTVEQIAEVRSVR